MEKNLFTIFSSTEFWQKARENQLTLLPCQVVIAVFAAILHTYGYSLIFRAQATPGGLEIISAHFAAQLQTKFSVSS